MPSLHPILQSPADWVDAVAALAARPSADRLPVRTVLVPSERHAHGLRAALVGTGRAAALAGTRLVGPATLAGELVAAAGLPLRPGEEGLRSARLAAILAGPLRLEHFDPGLLGGTPGWPEAFAAAISDLEGAGFSPDLLPASSAHWRDLAALWRRLDEAAGVSATAARLLTAAAALLEGAPRTAPPGPALAAITGLEPAAQLRFLRALPDATLALLAARPLRPRHLARVEALLGPAAREALAGAPPPAAQETERDLLVRHLFAAPEQQVDPGRVRSRGPDGTVELSEHSGVEAEVEAAAEWVAREVFTARRPLAEVAVLLPVADPLAALVASRLARLPSPAPGAPFPVHVAGGLPLSGTAGGARALTLLRALSAFLPAGRLAALLPALRIPLEGREHLSHAEAVGLAWSLGTVGGNAAHREGALSWPAAAAAREAQLAGRLAALARDPAAEEREGYRLRPELALVVAARPALEALSALARRVAADEPLSALAPALIAFMERWLLDPGPGAPVHSLLAGALEGARADALGGAVAGAAALELIEGRLRALRLPTCRFGAPAVYVGTLAGAAGLQFQAVRVLGLSEGSLPSPGREDPVLPDALRRALDPLRVPLAEDRVLAQLHAFDRVVRGAARALALSVPRSDLERSEREASSLLVDVGAALGRPDPAGGGAEPGLASLARSSFGPARAAAAAFAAAHPLTAARWQERAARERELHPSWAGRPHLDLDRIAALCSPTGLGPADGLLGADGPFPVMPGLDPARAISASALEKLLGCPLSLPAGARPPPARTRRRPLAARARPALLRRALPRRGGAVLPRARPGLRRPRADARRLEGAGAGAGGRGALGAAPELPAGGGGRPREGAAAAAPRPRRLPRVRLGPPPHPLRRRGAAVRLAGAAGARRRRHPAPRPRLRGPGRRRAGPRPAARPQDRARPPAHRRRRPGPPRPATSSSASTAWWRGSWPPTWGLPRELQAAYAYARNGEERAFRADHGRARPGHPGVAGAGRPPPRRARLPAHPRRRPLQLVRLPAGLRRGGAGAGGRGGRGRVGHGRRGRVPGAGGGRGMSPRTPPDQAHRDRAVAARGVNVLVDAGRRHRQDHAAGPAAGGAGGAAGRRVGAAPLPHRRGHLHPQGGRRAAAAGARAAPLRAGPRPRARSGASGSPGRWPSRTPPSSAPSTASPTGCCA